MQTNVQWKKEGFREEQDGTGEQPEGLTGTWELLREMDMFIILKVIVVS